MCVNINSFEFELSAILAASTEVEWACKSALSLSSALYVDSCIKIVESLAKLIIYSQGIVSPVYVILWPFRGGPRTCSGFIISPFTSTLSPL